MYTSKLLHTLSLVYGVRETVTINYTLPHLSSGSNFVTDVTTGSDFHPRDEYETNFIVIDRDAVPLVDYFPHIFELT